MKHFPNYQALVRELDQFGLTIRHGKGSHVVLTIGSNSAVMSSRFRDETLRLKPGMVRDILEDLGLTVEQVMARIDER